MEQKLNVPVTEKIKNIPGFFGIRLNEEPNYKVIYHFADFDLREYDKMVVATTWSESDHKHASEKSFMRLAGYIFGENQEQKTYAMTAPVFTEKLPNGWHMTFVLPHGTELESLPKPEQKLIDFKNEPVKKWAVLKFTGQINEEILKTKTDQLMAAVKNTNEYRVISHVRYAQYDSPSTIPFLRRNEIQIQVEPISH